MRIRIFSAMVSKELAFLIPRALILDIIIFLLTLPVYGICAEIPMGLLLGTAVMTLNFILLGYSAERAVERSISSAKRYMMLFYAIRFAVVGLLFYVAVTLPYINVVAAALPQLYPKILYTFDAALKKRKGGKDL